MPFEAVFERIDYALALAGRQDMVTILGVTKNRPPEDIVKLIDCGIVHIGENRVQEAREKFLQLEPRLFIKHLIGPLQKNKENNALELFDVIQSIESLEQAQRLCAKADQLLVKKKFFIQVNTAQDDAKHGLRSLGQLGKIVEVFLNSKYAELSGLMTIGALDAGESQTRHAFAALRQIGEKIVREYSLPELELSMGMSRDFEWAILEGSTMIRLGQILFSKN